MNKRIEEINTLERIKRKTLEEAFKKCQESGKHTYGKWSIDPNGLAIRTCQKCGTTEKLTATSEIEQEIKQQTKAEELLDYLYNTEDKSITQDDLLFYIYSIKDYLNYMDTNKLSKRINQLNNPQLNNKESFKLISMFSNSIPYFSTNIDTITEEEWEQYNELWSKIDSYVYGCIVDLTEKNTHHL